MNITTSVEQGSVPVTVLRPEGRLDGQTYGELIKKAAQLYEAGTRDILLDMSDVSYISSAGIVALHLIALILQGAPIPDLEDGWHRLRSAGRASEDGLQKHLKLYYPQPDVSNVLEMVGFSTFLESFQDKQAALHAF
ncbi:MAG: STAS domain-containing protein [Bacteroidota bacterium]